MYRAPIAASVALVLAVASPAKASLFTFDLSGSRNASFSIDSSRSPDFASGFQVQYDNVAGTYNGAAGIAPTISFGLLSFISAFEISGTSLGFSQFAGPVLFDGTSTMTSFLTGSFALTSIVSGSSTLTITEMPSVPTPEPASWAMLIAALALLGVARHVAPRPSGR